MKNNLQLSFDRGPRKGSLYNGCEKKINLQNVIGDTVTKIILYPLINQHVNLTGCVTDIIISEA